MRRVCAVIGSTARKARLSPDCLIIGVLCDREKRRNDIGESSENRKLVSHESVCTFVIQDTSVETIIVFSLSDSYCTFRTLRSYSSSLAFPRYFAKVLKRILEGNAVDAAAEPMPKSDNPWSSGDNHSDH